MHRSWAMSPTVRQRCMCSQGLPLLLIASGFFCRTENSPRCVCAELHFPTGQPAPAGDIPRSLWLPGLLASALAALAGIHLLFALPLAEGLLAMLLALLVAVLAVRALGDTDINPVSGIGKLTQAAFAALAPGGVLPNLVAGAASEAAAQQAGDMMQDFKTAHLLGVCPRAQFWAMLIGSAVSCGVSTAAFVLFQSVYDIGDPAGELPAPTAHVWLSMARLVSGHALPAAVVPFCYAAAAAGVVLAALPDATAAWRAHRGARLVGREAAVLSAVDAWMPSGIGFAIGMYVQPVFVIPRVLGSLAEQVWLRVAPGSHRQLMLIVASGLVLGEGIAALLVTIARAVL